MSESNRWTISIIIPAHDAGESLDRCLAGISRLSPPPLETIVVADGGADGVRQGARRAGARVIGCPERVGPARARNLGAWAAQGTILLFVDSDVVIPADTTAQIEEAFEEKPWLAALFGSYDDSPTASDFLSQYRNLFHHYIHQHSQEEAATFWAGCGAIRREVFLAAEGFEESYTAPSVEDIELGGRLIRRNHRILLHKGLQVTHLKRWRPLSLIVTDFRYRAIPWTRLILHDRRFINDLNLQLNSRLSGLLAYGLLASLPLSVLALEWLLVAGAMAAALLALNARLYLFFMRKRGIWFAVRAIPWHWLYYLYSGLAFGWGTCEYLCRRLWSTSSTDEDRPGGGSGGRLS